MATVGNGAAWAKEIQPALVGEIMDMLRRVWTRFKKPHGLESEVAITRRLRIALVRAKNMARLPVRIDREVVEDDTDSGAELGRIDIRFTHGFREEVYFAFECKNLNVSRRGRRSSLAGAYVSQGMMRFVTGRYSACVSHGGMLGYVRDGNIGAAAVAIARAIATRKHILGLLRGPADSSIRPGVASETHHKRASRRPICLQHLLLSC